MSDNKIYTKLRELRQESHKQLLRAMEDANREYCRIQVLDEVLGEDTLSEVLPGPFLKHVKVKGGSSPPSPQVLPSSKVSSVSPEKKVKRKMASSERGPAIEVLIENVLRLHPNEWLSVNQIRKKSVVMGEKLRTRQSVQGTIAKLYRKNTSWLARKEVGRLRTYSFAPSQTETLNNVMSQSE